MHNYNLTVPLEKIFHTPSTWNLLLPWWIPLSAFIPCYPMRIDRDDKEMTVYPSVAHQSSASGAGAQNSGLKRADPVPKLLPPSSGLVKMIANLCLLMDAIIPLVHSCGIVLPWSQSEMHKLPALFICWLVVSSLWGLMPQRFPRGACAVCTGMLLSQSNPPPAKSWKDLSWWRFIIPWHSDMTKELPISALCLSLASEVFFFQLIL